MNFSNLKVGSLLRLFGGASVVVAMAVKLIQGWAQTSTLDRYYIILAFEAVMVVLAAVFQFVYKEEKSARVCWAIGLLGITVVFSQWGSYVYDQNTFEVIPTVLSLFVVVPAAVGAIQYLPVFRSDFMTPIYFLASNAMFLVPFRDLRTSIILVLAQLIFRVLGRSSVFLLPIIILTLRTLLYPTDQFLVSFLISVVGAIVAAQSRKLSNEWGRALAFGGVCLLSLGWYMYMDALQDVRTISLVEFFQFSILGHAVVLLGVSLWLKEVSTSIRSWAGFFLAVGSLTLFPVEPPLFLTVSAFVFSCFCFMFGYLERNKIFFSFSSLAILVLIFDILSQALGWLNPSAWMTFSTLGIILIVFGSLYERNSAQWITKIRNLKDRFEGSK